MNVALREIMTLEQFLAWEEHQELRFEFDGFQPVAMTGGTDAHARIQINLTTALHNALRGKTCRPYGSHLKVLVDGRIRYPDAFVACTPTRPLDQLNTEPVVIFEILSPSTTNTDRIQQHGDYRATASVQRHVILQQSYPGALVFIRKGADWVAEPLAGLETVLRIPEIGIEIPISEIYADVELTGEPVED